VSQWYALIYAGHWPTGNPWTCNNDDVQRYHIVSSTIARMQEKANAKQ
jgi:hypothetical protein